MPVASSMMAPSGGLASKKARVPLPEAEAVNVSGVCSSACCLGIGFRVTS